MNAEVRKVHLPKTSRNGGITYTRIEFISDDGRWFHTDVVGSFRNAASWAPVIRAGVGTWIRVDPQWINADGTKMSADSRPAILEGPPESLDLPGLKGGEK